MSDYDILPYSYHRAKELGVKIVPSHNPNKKIDVLDYHSNYICSIGDPDFSDFPHYIKKYGLEYALERRRLYFIRHQRERDIEGTSSYYAKRILW
jgi:hypothetical protein